MNRSVLIPQEVLFHVSAGMHSALEQFRYSAPYK